MLAAVEMPQCKIVAKQHQGRGYANQAKDKAEHRVPTAEQVQADTCEICCVIFYAGPPKVGQGSHAGVSDAFARDTAKSGFLLAC